MKTGADARQVHQRLPWRSRTLLATGIILASAAAWTAPSRSEREGVATAEPSTGDTAPRGEEIAPATAAALEAPRRPAIRAPVHIRVVDDRGHAIARAHVLAHCRVTPEPQDCHREALTDEHGCATLELAPVDFPWLVYVNWRERTRPDHGRNALDVAVHGDAPQEHTVPLARLDANLRIEVRDDEERAVASTDVLVDFEDRAATTGADGVARFERLPAGHLPITIALPADSQLTLDGDGRQGITLHRGQTTTATFIAHRRGAIALRLPAAAREQCVDLEVASTRNGRNFVRQRARLASGGVALFRDLPRGDYTVRADHPADSPWNSKAGTTLTVRAGHTTEHVLHAAPVSGQMSGIVVDQLGRGVSGARIRVTPLTGGDGAASPKTTASDPSGRFQLSGIDDAPLAVHVDVSSLAEAHYRCLGDGITAYEAHERPRAGVVLRLLPGHRIRGCVTDRAGQPLLDCTISLRHEAAAIAHYARTRRDQRPPRLGDAALDAGWYEFGHLAPGRYELCAEQGSARARAYVDVRAGGEVLRADLVLEEQP